MAFDVTQQVRAVVTLDDRFSAGMGRIRGQLNSIGSYTSRTFSNVGRNIERIATRGAIVTGAALVGTIKAAADYQDAFATVRKTIDPLDADLDQLEKDFVALSKRIPVTAVDLADIGRVAGQLGIRGTGNINAFVETIATLSRVTDLQVDYASEQLGKLGAIFNFQGQDYRDFADLLVALGNNAASSEQELLDISRRFAAAGKAAGLTVPQILALSSTIASLGMLKEASGSALSRIFNNLTRNIGTADKKAKELAKVLGVPFKELRKQFATAPMETFKDLILKLNELYSSADPLDRLRAGKILKNIGINNVRDLNVIQQFAQNIEELNRQEKLAQEAYGGGALAKAAQERFKSFTSQWIMFKNNVDAAMIVFGTELFPALITVMGRFEKWLNENSGKIRAFGQEVAAGFNAFFDRFTPEMFDRVAGAIKTAAGAVGGLINAFLTMPDWIRNILVGGWALNKFTGGLVVDLAGLGMKGIFDQFLARGASPANPLWVQPVVGGLGGGPGGGNGIWGTGVTGKWLLGTAGSALLMVTAMKTVWDNFIFPSLDKEAGENISDIDRVLARGNYEEIRRMADNLRNLPSTLDPMQRLLYDLNASGVKVHNESLIQALEAWMRAHPPKPVNKSGSPDERDERNRKTFRPKNRKQALSQRDAPWKDDPAYMAMMLKLPDTATEGTLKTVDTKLQRVSQRTREVKTSVDDTKGILRQIDRSVRARFGQPIYNTVIVNVDGKKIQQATYKRQSYEDGAYVERRTGGQAP